MQKLYFLGPRGTFSEAAACRVYEITNQKYELEAVSTIAKIVDLTNKNPFSIAVLPIENSIEGIVRPTIDNIYLSDVKIQAQIEIKIEHCLISKGKKEQIKNIVSHPQALAQCQGYIASNFDENINLIEAASTAKAVQYICEKDETFGAIASEKCAMNFELGVLDKNISDVKDNKTRFVLVSKNDLNIAPKTRTSIAFNTKNKPGALLNILKMINKYNLNLVYLESRPSKKVFGEYNFFADIDSGEDKIVSLLNEIKSECNYYKMLGSYPCV